MKRHSVYALKETGINMASYLLGALTMFCLTNTHFAWALLLGVCWGIFLFARNRNKASKTFSSSAQMSSPSGAEATPKKALILPLAANGSDFLKKYQEEIADLTLEQLIEFAMEREPRWNRLTHLRLLKLHIPDLEVIFLFGSNSDERPGTCCEADRWSVFLKKLLSRSTSEPNRQFEVRIVEPGNSHRPLKEPPTFLPSYGTNQLQGWDFFNIDALLFLYEHIIKEAVENWHLGKADIAIDITSATVTSSLAGTFLSAPGSPANNYINQNDPLKIRDFQWYFRGQS